MQLSPSPSQDDALKTQGKMLLLSEIANKVKDKLVDQDEMRNMSHQDAKRFVIETAMDFIEKSLESEYKNIIFDVSEKSAIYEILIQNMFGYGVIEPYLKDDQVTEIMVNGYNNIFIEKNGKMEKALGKNGEPLSFTSQDELKSVVQKIVAPVNRKVDESDPIVDARLPDGSRVNIALNPVSLDGISVTIRRFPEKPYTMKELVEFGTLPENVAELLSRMVLAGYNMIVSGGTGSGKTTFLNALSTFIPPTNRVITVEDSAELKFAQVKNKVRLETRPPNIEGKGEISMRTLVRSALRMRPDRIIVGEVRGGEALDMLQAMNTGHDGSLSTGHANSALDMLMRLETMIMMAGFILPLSAIRQQIVSALDFIIHLGKLQGGRRKVLALSEIAGLNNGEYELNNIFELYEKAGTQELRYTGSPIRNTLKFKMAGITDYVEYLK